MPSTKLKKELNVNDRAPAFSLPDHTGKTVSLSERKGKKNVVLIFYPGDLTPGCTMQLCAIRDDWSKFQTAGATVFGINHGDAESHKSFIKKCGFPFPLLTDAKRAVSAKYGAVKKLGTRTVIRRTVAVVGVDGNILYLKHGMPKDADILKILKQV